MAAEAEFTRVLSAAPDPDSTRFAAATKPQAAKGSNLFQHTAIDVLVHNLFTMADPDEILRKAGLNRTALRALEYDDEISAALETRFAAIMSVPMQLEPYDEHAKFIEAELKPLRESLLSGFFSARLFGYSVIEHVFVRRDSGRIGLAEAAEKPFEWFTPARDGKLFYGANAASAWVDTTLKFNLTVCRPTWRQPYGEALLSRLYWPWFLRSAGWRFWSRFLERLGSPLLLGKTGAGAADLADTLLAAVQSGAVVVGSNDSVEVLESGTEGGSFMKFEGAVSRRMQKLILGQTLTTEVGPNGGSRALGEVHNEVRKDRRAADLRLITAAMQRTVDALSALNAPGRPAPQVSFDAGRELATERAERDSKLVTGRVIGGFTREYIRNRYDLDDDDFLMPSEIEVDDDAEDDASGDAKARKGKPGASQNDKASHAAGKARTKFAGGAREREPRRELTEDQQAVEDLALAAAGHAGNPVAPEAIRNAIRLSANEDELVDRLAELFQTYNDADYRVAMEQALFAAQVLGLGHAVQDVRQD